MSLLSEYEEKQFQDFLDWRNEQPSNFVPGRIGKNIERIYQLVGIQWFVRKAIDWSQKPSTSLSRRISKFDFIKNAPKTSLKECDQLANYVHRSAQVVVGVEGGGTGIFGLLTIAPSRFMLVGFSLTTLKTLGYCYGFDFAQENSSPILLSIVRVGSAMTPTTKKETLEQIVEKMITPAILEELGADLALKLQESESQYRKRDVFDTLPVVGAVWRAYRNTVFLNNIAWAGRRLFQLCWLFRKGKLSESQCAQIGINS